MSPQIISIIALITTMIFTLIQTGALVAIAYFLAKLYFQTRQTAPTVFEERENIELPKAPEIFINLSRGKNVRS